MIPVELKIKGLYSFKEEQVIDFSTLLESHLFGIFGKVGSGKSTILEAITFVLYGESERLGGKDNRKYNMMNLTSNDMSIEFVFKAGTPRVTYKAVAYAKRNRKSFEKIGTSERKLFKQKAGEWIPIDTADIDQIIGLTYKNFKRAIIIPQGKFQEFLGLNHTERSTMLKEIFHLQKFDLSAKVNILQARNNEAVSNLVGQLEQLADVSPDRLKEQEKELKSLTISRQKAEVKLKNNQAQFKESEKVKSLFEELIIAKDDYLTYGEKYEARFQEMEKEAQKVAYCQQHFRTDLEHWERQEKEVIALETEVEKTTKKLQSIDDELVSAQKSLKDIKVERDKKDDYLSVVADIDKGIKRADFLVQKKKLDAEWEARSKEIEQLEKELASYENREKSNKTRLEKLELKRPSTLEFKVKEWHSALQVFEQDVAAFKKDLKDRQAQLDKVLNAKDKIIRPIVKILPKLQKLSPMEGVDLLKMTLQTYTDRQKRVSEKEKALLTQNALVEHAGQLVDGEACPLCGALEHPNVLTAGDVKQEWNQVQVELKEISEFLESGRDVLLKLHTLAGDLLNHQTQFNEINTKIQKLEKAKIKHLQSKPWKEGATTSLEDILTKVEHAEETEKEMASLKEQIAKNEQVREKSASRLKVVSADVADLEKQRNQWQSKVDLLSEEIAPEIMSHIQAYSIPEMESLRQKYQQKIIKNDRLFLEREQQVKVLQEQQTALTTTLKLHTKNLQKEKKVLDKINQKLAKTLAHSAFDQLEEVKALLAMKMDPQTQLERVAKYQKEAFAKKQKWQELQAKTKNLKFDEKAFTQLQQLIQDQQDDLKNKVGAIAQVHALIQELIRRVAQKKDIEKQLKALEIRADHIKTLKQLFTAQGFVNYISSVYLQNIVHAANHRFQSLTKHELALELDTDNSFVVRDQLNGGKKRNIKTLSGGQTFQAALCLALALADNIHELTKSEKNFFFLDEGFGSQDNEAIADVFNTLKALRKENRTVGVISHVDSLQQEIDVHLKVELDAEKGSLVRKSW
ncbi:MAG TPA: SMC family ATPase [Saprospiraceae bacterium]|nr:SMC family ATPase [Saprospiraceae bacterium]